jgi:site-specific recombinase XerD
MNRVMPRQIKGLWRESDSVPKDLATAVNLYTQYLTLTRRHPKTINERQYDLARFGHYLLNHSPQPPLIPPPPPTASNPNIPNIPLTAITPQAIASYIASIRPHYSQHTTRRHLASIRALCQWLTERGAFAHNPAEHIRPIPIPDKLPRTLTSEETRALDAAAQALISEGRPRPAVIYLLVRDTAIRTQELHALTLADYHPTPPRLTIRADEEYRQRTLALSAETARALETYLPTRHHKASRLIDAAHYTIRTDIYEVSQRAGLCKRACYHDLRWTAALAIYRADPFSAQAALGYSDEGWSNAAEILRRLNASR